MSKLHSDFAELILVLLRLGEHLLDAIGPTNSETVKPWKQKPFLHLRTDAS